MLEPWRSQYLGAIGIDVYLPRYQLPAAGPSVELLWDAAGAVSTADLPVAVAELQSISPQAAPAPAIASIVAEAPRQIPNDLTAGASADNSPVGQIRLFVAAADTGILIVDDILPPAQRQHSLRLLANLLFAIERKAVNLTGEQFDWPLPGLRNRHVALDEQAARETLNGFLTRQILSRNISTIYLLGDAAHWISKDQRRLLDADRPLQWRVSSVSTQSVLRDARLKQRWWQDLRAAQSHH